MNRPVWVGVAIMDGFGNLTGWEMHSGDEPIQIRTEQAGVYSPSGRFTAEQLARMLVSTQIHIRGKARRWGPGAGRGSVFNENFRIPEQPKEIGS